MSLKDLGLTGYDIIIGTTRTTGQTVDFYNDLSKQGKLDYIYKLAKSRSDQIPEGDEQWIFKATATAINDLLDHL